MINRGSLAIVKSKQGASVKPHPRNLTQIYSIWKLFGKFRGLQLILDVTRSHSVKRVASFLDVFFISAQMISTSFTNSWNLESRFFRVDTRVYRYIKSKIRSQRHMTSIWRHYHFDDKWRQMIIWVILYLTSIEWEVIYHQWVQFYDIHKTTMDHVHYFNAHSAQWRENDKSTSSYLINVYRVFPSSSPHVKIIFQTSLLWQI